MYRERDVTKLADEHVCDYFREIDLDCRECIARQWRISVGELLPVIMQAELKKDELDIVTGYFLENKTVSQLGRELDLPRSTVNNRLIAGLCRLRRSLRYVIIVNHAMDNVA